jgi:alpha-L-rhamnosidase
VVAVGAEPHAVTGDDPVAQAAADQAVAGALLPAVITLPAVLEQPGWGSARVVVVDLGEETAGLVSIDLDAPEGTRIDARAAEDRSGDGGIEPLQQRSGFRYVARGHDDRFETLDPIGLRYLQLSIRGDGPVTLRSVEVRERHRPRPDGPCFASSDPVLDRIWRIGVRTVDLCAQDAYLDCPSREQRAWTGDAVVHQMVDLVANPDWSLARWNVELAASPRPDGMLPMAAGGDLAWRDEAYIPDWALHWVHALHNLYLHDRDDERLARLLPVAERVVDWFRPFVDDGGLLSDVTGWLLVDWSAVTTVGTSGAVTALWARALTELAAMADHLGDAGRAARARAAFARVHEGFDALWDDERGVYVDHLLDGVPGRTVSQHTNAAAIAAGLVPADRTRGVIDRILDPHALVQASWLVPGREAVVEGAGDMYADVGYLAAGAPEPWWDVDRGIVAAQPFFRYVVHDAVAAAGLAHRIPQLCRDWTRLLDRETSTWRETWFGGSHCHGWSATPTRDLSTHTLGVRPGAPGYAVVEIAPDLGDLDHARGAVVTPDGLVEVDVGSSHLEVDTPGRARVHWSGRTFEVEPGRHRFEA